MKQTFTIFAALVLTALQFTAAQESVKRFSSEQETITFATRNLLVCLRADNPGVIESALKVIPEMKMRYPKAEMSDLIREMRSIKKNNKDGAIRYKAFLAISVCENPEWYSELMEHWTENSDLFFRSASSVLNERLLSSVN